jgi:hypothetical protein
MLQGKEAESEAIVERKSFPGFPLRVSPPKIHRQMLLGRKAGSEASVGRKP